MTLRRDVLEAALALKAKQPEVFAVHTYEQIAVLVSEYLGYEITPKQVHRIGEMVVTGRPVGRRPDPEKLVALELCRRRPALLKRKNLAKTHALFIKIIGRDFSAKELCRMRDKLEQEQRKGIQPHASTNNFPGR